MTYFNKLKLKRKVAIPTLLSQVALEVVVETTTNATSDNYKLIAVATYRFRVTYLIRFISPPK